MKPTPPQPPNGRHATLPLTKRALAGLVEATRTGDEGRQTQIALDAANAAQKAREAMTTLRIDLAEALARLETAETAKDAHLALTWLRTSLFDEIRTAIAQLEVYSKIDQPTPTR